jgi:hypothetical protein
MCPFRGHSCGCSACISVILPSELKIYAHCLYIFKVVGCATLVLPRTINAQIPPGITSAEAGPRLTAYTQGWSLSLGLSANYCQRYHSGVPGQY